jgi:hypothetical protein
MQQCTASKARWRKCIKSTSLPLHAPAFRTLPAVDQECSQKTPLLERSGTSGAGTHHGAQLHAGLQRAQVDGAVAGALADAAGRRRHLLAAEVLQVVAVPNLPAAQHS